MLPVLIALCIAWVTWPTYTFQSFCSSIRNEEVARVNSVIESDDCSFEYKKTPDYPTGGLYWKKTAWGFECSSIPWFFLERGYIQDRSFTDVLFARSSFVFPHDHRFSPQFKFVIERGKIRMQCYDP